MIIIKIIDKIIRRTAPSRLIAAGFAAIILIGALLLMLPISLQPGTRLGFIDAIFTSTSAMCVTGLVTTDPGSTFSVFGRCVIGILIQIGGLGVATVGVSIIIAAGANAGLRGMAMIKESLNISSAKGIWQILKKIFVVTAIAEQFGAILSFAVLLKYYPPLKAAGFAIFHSISSFNNAGFDIFGKGTSLIPYNTDIAFNIITMLLIITGGLGFTVILDTLQLRRRRQLTLHSRVVLATSASLIIIGAVLLRFTVKITWLGAFFQSVSTRTAGFSSFDIGKFSDAGLFICIILMLIGASPGSTGGGIKTTTFFAVLVSLKSTATNSNRTAFRRRIPAEAVNKAFTITILAVCITVISTIVLCVSNPQNTFIQNFFESASALGTAGLSTGITSGLNNIGKITIIITMYTGRLGTLAITTLLARKTPHEINYVEEQLTIG